MNDSRLIAEKLLKTFFTTFDYPLTHAHLNSYDQFIANDIPAIIKYSNPILLLQEKIGNTDEYTYRVEIFIGGINGDQFYIGTPTVSLKGTKEVRVLYPNEARLRNLTYASNIEADIVIKVTFTQFIENKLESSTVFLDPNEKDTKYAYLGRIPLCRLPIMLHSKYCLLRDKPHIFLQEVGESTNDYGGYFIIDGAEKVLITQQEQAFNTLYIAKQNDPAVEIYSSIQCLNPETRQVKRIAFSFMRNTNTILVSIPFVRKAIPLFVLFRALGVNADEDIIRLIFPDENDIETKILAPLLHESILDAHPFLDTYSAIQYIKVLTKGFSEAHVYDILLNQMFIHVENKPMNKALFLAECVRKILRVSAGIDTQTDRDDIRNQRCLTSGFLTRLLFLNVYKKWSKQVTLMIDKEFKFNKKIYSGNDFLNLFLPGNINTFFQVGLMTEGITRGFKGKWTVGPSEDKAGIIQPLSRLSYLDFLSHCRRVVLDFDTGMKLQGPRRLHPTQFGYFCTSETPGGSSIGITKNLSILTAISLSMNPAPFIEWMFKKMGLLYVNDLTPLMLKVAVPVFVNSGIVGYSRKPRELVEVTKLFKHTGCLPAYSSISFNIRERNVSFYFDEGRPVRPLIYIKNGVFPIDKLEKTNNWRDLIIGTYEKNRDIQITTSIFRDPIDREANAEDYIKLLKPYEGVIEYVDPYESNEAFIAMYPELRKEESTHIEIHPSTMLGLLTSMIPFPNHNQSPRNQLSCSQSKQGISIPSLNYKNRFDNQTHILCYGEAPLVRTLYYDYVADGKIGYGHNLILAMGCFTGYNQEDGIVFNADSFQRGMFRNMTYRSYETFEEDDKKANTKTRVGNPANIPGWIKLRPGVDYKKLDERGIIKKGEYADENTVLVGRYIQGEKGEMADASLTAQVWTAGIVEEVCVTVNNAGLSLVKIRIIQDRVPELGDKFCLTPDHDVLTKERGWVSINNISLDDTVAQLNRKTGSMEYIKPKEVFVFDHDGYMYEVESQGVSLKTTLNHRMWIQKRNEKTYELTEASNIIGKRVRYQSDAPIDNAENHIKIGKYIFNKGTKANAWLQFFGIWIAEGWTYIKESEYINRVEFAANKEIVQIKLKESCDVLEWNYSFNNKSNKFYVNEKEITQYLDILSIGAINKELPKWVFELSVDQTRLLIGSLCAGDGYETNTSLQYFTSSIKLKDDIQQLVQHAGWTSYSSIRYKKGWISPTLNKQGKQFIANADAWVIGIRKTRLRPTINHGHIKTQNGQKEIVEKYNGKVYCLSVESEVFLVRRNGKITFTGNSNRHGQKGTIGMLVRAVDMPRTADGLVPDMIMNPHAIPSRMTIAQLLESLLGKSACLNGFIGDATAFMNESGVEESIGNSLEKSGFQRYGEELFYDGTTGGMVPSSIFVGNVYTMRLKHMVEDKWNARGEGRKEQRTHQPTGGRGNQGGLRIGEMERDALLGHGISDFIRESYMKRSDGTTMLICNGCGTVPIYNEKNNFYFCSLCDGPALFVGESAGTLELLPSLKRSVTSFSSIELPYAFEVLNKEMNTYMNMYMRYLTAKDVRHIRKTGLRGLKEEEVLELLKAELVPRVIEYSDEPPEEEAPVVNTLEVVEEEQIPELEINVEQAKSSIEKMKTLESEPISGENADDLPVSVMQSPPSELLSQEVQEQMQNETQQVLQQPYILLPLGNTQTPLQIINAPTPTAPKTIVVDTSPQAMEAEGMNMYRPRSILRRPNSPSRFSRSKSPTSFNISKEGESYGGSDISDASSIPPNTKFNIVKEG